MQTIDSHVHLDLIGRDHPDRIEWLKCNHCGVVSWAYLDGPGTMPELEKGLRTIANAIGQYAASGLDCWYLIGVHPRSIPPDLRPEQVAPLLAPYLADPQCLGIGEIGLETGGTREQEVLLAQLELGRDRAAGRKIIGVHTPRSNKAEITRRTLSLLAAFTDLADRVVVDHCTQETIGAVLEAGFRAGVTLSPAKTGWQEMRRIVANHPDCLDRIMCNTDSGSPFYDDVVRYRSAGDLPETVRDRIFFSNAARFFNVTHHKESV